MLPKLRDLRLVVLKFNTIRNPIAQVYNPCKKY